MDRDFEAAMVEHTGTCKFCNQLRVVKVPVDYDQKMIDEEVTATCDCEAAEAEKVVMDIIASAEMQIKEFFKDRGMDLFKDMLLNMVEPMARKKVERINIKAGKYQISMKRKSFSIEVRIKVVTEEKVES